MAHPIDGHIPESVINIEIHLPEDFTIPGAQDALTQIAQGMNRMLGIAMAKNVLSAASPVAENLFKAAAHIEMGILVIRQIEAQMKQQNSRIVDPFQVATSGRPS